MKIFEGVMGKMHQINNMGFKQDNLHLTMKIRYRLEKSEKLFSILCINIIKLLIT